jgi:hypothetical protein
MSIAILGVSTTEQKKDLNGMCIIGQPYSEKHPPIVPACLLSWPWVRIRYHPARSGHDHDGHYYMPISVHKQVLMAERPLNCRMADELPAGSRFVHLASEVC